GAKLVNPDLKLLARCPKLRLLGLDETEIGDEAAQAFPFLTSLRDLSLSGANVGDQGMEQITECRWLEALDISLNRDISARSAVKLSRMPFLREVYCYGTGLEHEYVVRWLDKANPLILNQAYFGE